jgi:carbonic anhydrase
MNRLAELNVMVQIKNLYQTSIIRKCLRENNAPQIHGWVINLKTGLIKDMEVPLFKF